MVEKGKQLDHVLFDNEDKNLIFKAINNQARKRRATKELKELAEGFNIVKATQPKRELSLNIGRALVDHLDAHYQRRRLGVRPFGARKALRLSDAFAVLETESPNYDPPEANPVTTISHPDGIPQSGIPQDKELLIDLRHTPPGYEAALNLSD